MNKYIKTALLSLTLGFVLTSLIFLVPHGGEACAVPGYNCGFAYGSNSYGFPLSVAGYSAPSLSLLGQDFGGEYSIALLVNTLFWGLFSSGAIHFSHKFLADTPKHIKVPAKRKSAIKRKKK